MPWHSAQRASYVNTRFQPKIIQKLLLSSIFGYFYRVMLLLICMQNRIFLYFQP